ncbi:MAG: ATP-binding cassette domain-containing protein [Gracilibacteraceae bacterium]|jgi:molybdate transport system ATP-binding protein|nr:ATP-binding cassette domain-containing protein [Gracilibacteraceae bacterium]
MSLVVDIQKNLGDFCLDVSFETEGGVTGLLGASGSGKSMTLMCIAGVVKPSRGKIVLNGRTLFDAERRVDLTPQQRRVGYLFQHYALFPNMTVRQNILCGLRSGGEKAGDRAAKERSVRDIMKIMRLEGLENRRPGQLSGGQQQRVALARILVGDPDLLILDEPFSALDSHLRGQLQVETQRLLKGFGKDAVLVTHSRDEAYQLCRRIALLEAGELIVCKETKGLFSDPGSRTAALLTGCKNVVDAKKTGAYEVRIPAWGVRFTTAQPVGDDLCAVGVRAHYFDPEAEQNRFPVLFADEIESPFEYSFQFRYAGQSQESPDVWWNIPKEKRKELFPGEMGVAPANILLLYR